MRLPYQDRRPGGSKLYAHAWHFCKEIFDMTVKVERLPGEPIIMITWSRPTDVQKESPQKFADVNALIGSDEKVYVIEDMTDLKIDFSTLVSGMASQRVKVPGSPADPRTKTMLVGSGIIWELASKGAKKLPDGGFDIPLFPSLEAALVHAREKIASW
jgi:hypothetical protein